MIRSQAVSGLLTLLVAAIGLYSASIWRMPPNLHHPHPAVVEYGGPHLVMPEVFNVRKSRPEESAGRSELRRMEFIEQRIAPRRTDLNKSAKLLHALLAWGPTVRLVDGGDDAFVLDALVGTSSSLGKASGTSLFYLGPDGSVRTMARRSAEDVVGEAHFDQAMAVFSLIGVSLDHPIVIEGETRPATLRDAFSSLLMRFTPDLFESEWTAIPIAVYLPPLTRWKNQWNEEYTLTDVAHALLQRPSGTGSCGGTHRLHALCLMLRIDEQQQILEPVTSAAIRAHLEEVRAQLQNHQLESGAWTRDWSSPDFDPDAADPGSIEERYNRLIVTGHHLDWLTIAPEALRPPDDVLYKAVDWCIAELMADEALVHVNRSVCPLVHALMSAYRFRYPDQMYGRWLSMQPLAFPATSADE